MSTFGGKAGSQRGAAISSTHANIIQRPVATAAAWELSPSSAVAEIVVLTISRASFAGQGRPRCIVAQLSHMTTSPVFQT